MGYGCRAKWDGGVWGSSGRALLQHQIGQDDITPRSFPISSARLAGGGVGATGGVRVRGVGYGPSVVWGGGEGARCARAGRGLGAGRGGEAWAFISHDEDIHRDRLA